jgi:DNA repair and recombination RAD54-like protein
MQIMDGDIEVNYAPVLPFLTVPDRKAALAKPFKLPDGAVRSSEAPRKTLGARRKRPDGVKLPVFKPVATSLDLPEDEEDEEEEAETPSAAPAAAPADAPFEPLILWKTAEGVEPAYKMQVDPILCKFLREHQREGVQFVFDCITGAKPFAGNGCILADDMGLGKTLQSITLLYTVLKQGMNGTPMVKRAIVVCPTSLVANWAKEICKWVGDRLKVLPLAEASRDKAIMDINTFISTRQFSILIISYETFRIHAARFHARPDSCDLLICDEAHRLKNDKTLTTQALAGLACRRRILLSGTPMQNDLDEFWAMVDFTNPGVLGDAAAFRKRFSSPILEAREPWASERVKAAGDEASKELSGIVNQFILRRTNTLLSKHLPPKLMQVVCVRLAPLQQALYNHFLSSKELSLIMSGTQKGVLSSITGEFH